MNADNLSVYIILFILAFNILKTYKIKRRLVI